MVKFLPRGSWVDGRSRVDGHDLRSAFWRSDDGSWICIDPVTIEHPQGRLQVAPGMTLIPGTLYMGIDLASWLDEQLKKARGPDNLSYPAPG